MIGQLLEQAGQWMDKRISARTKGISTDSSLRLKVAPRYEAKQ